MTCDDANPFPDDTAVLVKFPRTEEQGDQAVKWPGLPGHRPRGVVLDDAVAKIVRRAGPDRVPVVPALCHPHIRARVGDDIRRAPVPPEIIHVQVIAHAPIQPQCASAR